MKVVTARIYIDDEGEDPRELLAEVLTTYASGLIDPDEREELLLRFDLVSILRVEDAFDPVDERELERRLSSMPYAAEGG